MARLFTDGAEFGDVLFWDSPSSVAVSSAIVRSGNYSYIMNNATPIKYITPLPEIYVRFGIYMDTSPNGDFFFWRSGGTVLGKVNHASGTGLATVYVGNTPIGSFALQIGVFHLLEFHIKIADTGGVIQVKLGGNIVIDYTGDTKPGTETTINNFQWSRGLGGNIYIDDLAANDTSGSVDNSWCGDGRVILLTPNNNGDESGLTGSDGNNIDNYLLVDEFPHDSDNTYVEGDTPGVRDLYRFSLFTVSGGVDIRRIWVESRARETVAASGLAAFDIKTYSTVYSGSSINLLNNYALIRGNDYIVNPYTGSAWTVSELNNLQAGPRVG